MVVTKSIISLFILMALSSTTTLHKDFKISPYVGLTLVGFGQNDRFEKYVALKIVDLKFCLISVNGYGSY